MTLVPRVTLVTLVWALAPTFQGITRAAAGLSGLLSYPFATEGVIYCQPPCVQSCFISPVRNLEFEEGFGGLGNLHDAARCPGQTVCHRLPWTSQCHVPSGSSTAFRIRFLAGRVSSLSRPAKKRPTFFAAVDANLPILVQALPSIGPTD